MATTFQTLSDKTFDVMTEAEKVAAYKSSALQEPLVADLQTLVKFTVIMYRDNATT